jgi:hypothetical protein
MAGDRSDTQRIAWLALIFFVGGLLLPFALYPILVSRFVELPHQLAIGISVATGAVCELLALALGVVGRRHLPGKVAGVGSGVLIGLTLFGIVALMFR